MPNLQILSLPPRAPAAPAPASGMALPSGTLAFLFTDIEGSTKRWENTPEPMRRALAQHDRILRAAIRAQDGHVFRSVGDSFCAAFRTASQALAAAMSAQQALAEEDFSPVGGMQVRMALHAGSAESRDQDYYGSAVNRAARLAAIAHGGQVILSRAVMELAREALPSGASLRPLGRHGLKDLSLFEEVYQLVAPGLAEAFPALRSMNVVPNNLPPEMTSFIGRDAEQAGLREILRSGRLVTLFGPGGVGKTRLALRVAAGLRSDYPDGTWFVDLASVECARRVPAEIANVLGIRPNPGAAALDALAAELAQKTALIVLDNCEHLHGACVDLVESLLRDCRKLSIIATSRQVLHARGEYVRRIGPLSVPGQAARLTAREAMADEAVQLFVARVDAALGGFRLDDAMAPVVAEICRRLDGIPLAIEIAAARTSILPPAQLLERLEQGVSELVNPMRSAPARHRSTTALLDSSYVLLSPAEKALLRCISALGSRWTFQQALRNASSNAVNRDQLVDLLGSLVEKSWVMFDAASPTPYRLLNSIRHYAQMTPMDAGTHWSRAWLAASLHRFLRARTGANAPAAQFDADYSEFEATA